MSACADTPARFSGTCTVSWTGQPTAVMPCLSENLPAPGYNNRWHVILYPSSFIPAPAIYRMATIVRDEALADGRTRMDIGFFVHLEILPDDPAVQAVFRSAAGATETRPQRVSIGWFVYGKELELLIEEPVGDVVNHTASPVWSFDFTETFLILGSVH